MIAKLNYIDSDFTIYNDSNVKLNGAFKTWGMMASAEAGQKVALKNGNYYGYYGQVAYGHVAGKSYNAHSDYNGGKDMHVTQDDFNSLVGRVGVRFGNTSTDRSWYLKAALAHEFAGVMKTTYAAVGEPTATTKAAFKDTWTEIGFGGTFKISQDKYIYGNVERSFGAELETEWRVDAGIRMFF